MLTIEDMVKIVESSSDYKVIKNFKRIESYNEPSDARKHVGIFVDVETTGSFVDRDKIIELALVPFEYDNDGNIYRVLESYVEFQDPGAPIPESIKALTGIDDEMVVGKSFNVEIVNKLAESASIIIAHHASFDKKFVTKIFPIFEKKLWACTVAHIKWRAEDISSSKLEYLAYKFGVFYKAHRAEIDSLIGVHILAQTLPLSKQLAMKSLLDNVSSKHYKIWAENSPYESKNILKARGYRWNNGKNNQPKSWYKIVREQVKENEINFLFTEIYGKNVDLKIEPFDLFEDI